MHRSQGQGIQELGHGEEPLKIQRPLRLGANGQLLEDAAATVVD